MAIDVAVPSLMTTIYRSRSVPRLPGLLSYVYSVASDFCPLLWPSVKQGMTRHSVYVLGGNPAKLAETIFYLGLLHTELLRRDRRQATLTQQALLCENLFFRFDSEDEVDGAELFSWPHWLLKSYHTEAGVMYGKFWKGEMIESQKGFDIPPPPYHMLSVRSAVKPRDPAFFTRAPELLDSLLEANDNQQYPMAGFGLSQKFYDQLLASDETPESMLDALCETDAYSKALVASQASRA